MAEVIYQVVEHDGGWAYKAEGSFYETFPTREAAKQLVESVATAGPVRKLDAPGAAGGPGGEVN